MPALAWALQLSLVSDGGPGSYTRTGNPCEEQTETSAGPKPLALSSSSTLSMLSLQPITILSSTVTIPALSKDGGMADTATLRPTTYSDGCTTSSFKQIMYTRSKLDTSQAAPILLMIHQGESMAPVPSSLLLPHTPLPQQLIPFLTNIDDLPPVQGRPRPPKDNSPYKPLWKQSNQPPCQIHHLATKIPARGR